jgi:hypothetical protein
MVIPPEVEKVLVKLETSITSILHKTKDGVIPRDDFAETEREIKKVKTAFDGLAGVMDGLSKADRKRLEAFIP